MTNKEERAEEVVAEEVRGWVGLLYRDRCGHVTSDDHFHELSFVESTERLGEKRIGILHQPAPRNRRTSGHGHLHHRRRRTAECVNV